MTGLRPTSIEQSQQQLIELEKRFFWKMTRAFVIHQREKIGATAKHEGANAPPLLLRHLFQQVKYQPALRSVALLMQYVACCSSTSEMRGNFRFARPGKEDGSAAARLLLTTHAHGSRCQRDLEILLQVCCFQYRCRFGKRHDNHLRLLGSRNCIIGVITWSCVCPIWRTISR